MIQKNTSLFVLMMVVLGCKTYPTKNTTVVNSKDKNLLFIIVDQQRYDALSIAGNPIVKTPNLDKLARQGAYFKNAYTPVAVCGPARSSILTGTTINTHRVTTNDKTYDYNDTPVMTMKTFDEILTEKGCEWGLVPQGGIREKEIREHFEKQGVRMFYIPEQFRGFCRH